MGSPGGGGCDATAATPGNPAAGDLAPGDLAVVLSHYDLGVIERIEPIGRGTASTPKFVVRSERGAYVVKRRRERAEEAARVAYTHAVQLTLTRAGYPCPSLLGTARHRSSVVTHGGRMFELHTLVRGRRRRGTAEEARSAGALLARWRRVLDGATIGARGHRGSFHAAPVVESRLAAIPADAADAAAGVLDAYRRARDAVDAAGFAEWPIGPVHGDYHPGNLLFDDDGSARWVLDFDRTRIDARATDVATGLLQFSLTRSGDGPAAWSGEADPERLGAFWDGFVRELEGSGVGSVERVLGEGAVEAMPMLMIEALIAESAGEAATGERSGPMTGEAFVSMVGRKAAWLEERAGELASDLASRAGG